jgi:hypothetical protein
MTRENARDRPTLPPRFSMLRTFTAADFVTLINAVSGISSILSSFEYVRAPAVLAFSVGMNGGWDWAVLTYFVCCGLSRLARYNATAEELADESGKVSYFEGTPIPTSLVLVAIGDRCRAGGHGQSARQLASRLHTTRTRHAPPAGRALFGERQPDDQRTAARAQALKRTGGAPPAHGQHSARRQALVAALVLGSELGLEAATEARTVATGLFGDRQKHGGGQ